MYCPGTDNGDRMCWEGFWSAIQCCGLVARSSSFIGAVEDGAVIPCSKSIAPATNAIKILAQEHPTSCTVVQGLVLPSSKLFPGNVRLPSRFFIIEPIMLREHMGLTSGQPWPSSWEQEAKHYWVIEEMSVRSSHFSIRWLICTIVKCVVRLPVPA